MLRELLWIGLAVATFPLHFGLWLWRPSDIIWLLCAAALGGLFLLAFFRHLAARDTRRSRAPSRLDALRCWPALPLTSALLDAEGVLELGVVL